MRWVCVCVYGCPCTASTVQRKWPNRYCKQKYCYVQHAIVRSWLSIKWTWVDISNAPVTNTHKHKTRNEWKIKTKPKNGWANYVYEMVVSMRAKERRKRKRSGEERWQYFAIRRTRIVSTEIQCIWSIRALSSSDSIRFPFGNALWLNVQLQYIYLFVSRLSYLFIGVVVVHQHQHLPKLRL